MYKKQKNRKNKLIFSRFFPFLTFSPLFFLTSAINDPQKQIISQEKPQTDNDKGKAGQSDQEKKGEKDQKKADADPKKDLTPITNEDLKKNQAWWESKKEEFIDRFIGQVDNDIKAKLADINAKNKDNVEERLQQSFFWIQLRYYFQKNREGIKKDPRKYGLNIISPFAFANNLKLKRGDVTFDKENYQGLEWGNNQNDDYAKIQGVKTDKVLDVPNTLKGQEFEERIKTYFKGLESGYKQYLFKEEEFPVYKKNFNLNLDRESIDDKENILLASKPMGKEGISTWNDWIKNYFEKQSLLLDFSLNQLPNPSSSKSEIEQINLAIKKITKQNPPQISEKPEFEVRIAPDLPPIVAPEYTNLSSSEIINLYNSASQEKKSEIFFFLNPLNSRFKYNIESISEADGKIKARIKITDFVNKVRESSDKKKYEKVYESLQYDDFEGASPWQRQAITTNLYHSNLGVTAVIDNFFETVNVNDQFSFDQIRYYSPGSQTTIYNFFYLLTKVFYNQDFLEAQKKMAREYINSSLSSVFSASQFQFLSYLKKSEIDNNKAWLHYYLIYFINLYVLQEKFNRAKQTISELDGKAESSSEAAKQLDATLEKLNLTREDINRFFAQAHEKIALFHNESYKLTSNLVNSFLKMTKLGREINQLSQILGQIAYFAQKDENKDQNSAGQSQDSGNAVQNFADLIQEYKLANTSKWLEDNLLYLIIGLISGILITLTVFLRRIIYKRKQNLVSQKNKGDQ